MQQDEATQVGYSLFWDDYEYQFAPLTDRVKGYFASWIKSRAQASPHEEAANMTKADGSTDLQRIADTRALITNNVTTLQYDWGGSLCSASLNGLPGQSKLLQLAFLAHPMNAKAMAGLQPLDQEKYKRRILKEMEGLVMVKTREAIAKNIPTEQSEIGLFLGKMMEDSFPKSREVFLKSLAAEDLASQ